MAADPVRERNKHDEMAQELSSLSARYQKLLEDYQALLESKNNADKLISDLLHSLSWRVTKPLRLGLRILRTLWPPIKLARWIPKITDESDVTLHTDGSYEVDGSTPYLTFSVDQELSGWQRINFECEKPFYFHLSLQEGATYTDQYKRFVSIDPEKPYYLFESAPGTKRIRLDFFETGEPFKIGIKSIKSLSNLEAACLLVKEKLGPSPKYWMVKAKKAFELYRIGGFGALKIKLIGNEQTNDYTEWVERYDTLTDDDKILALKDIETFSKCPLISVILPAYNTPEEFLRKAIESVITQWYPHWELCIADDASTQPHVQNVIREYASNDPRIKFIFRDKNGHISASSNSSLSLATGEYVALLDHDDELRPHALYLTVKTILANPKAKLIYSDEDKITTFGMRFNPYFKCDWNAELFYQQNFVCHLTVIKREIMQKVGGFREGFEGSQDWDLFLRVIDSIEEDEIFHIPHILYHWRALEGSTAQSSTFKPYALAAGKKAIEEHFERKNIRATVSVIEAISHYRISYALPKVLPLVSIIIPTRDKLSLLSRCVESIVGKTKYPNFEIIIVDNGSKEQETMSYFRGITTDARVRVLRDDSPFNFSGLNNRAAKAARGNVLAFLNNDLEVINNEWLTEMVSHALQPHNAAVGARLWFPNGLLQHGGVILGIGGVAGHNHKGQPRSNVGYFNRAILAQNLSAVTAACMVVRKDVFEQVGGFDEKQFSVAFNDVDICLRFRKLGYLNVWTPFAELYHFESVSRGYEHTPEKFDRFQREISAMKSRWGTLLSNDPYYNPNLTIQSEDFRYGYPPRKQYPWKHN